MVAAFAARMAAEEPFRLRDNSKNFTRLQGRCQPSLRRPVGRSVRTAAGSLSADPDQRLPSTRARLVQIGEASAGIGLVVLHSAQNTDEEFAEQGALVT